MSDEPTLNDDETMLNSQVTDAVTQTDVIVLAEAPAIAMGNLYQATARHSLSPPTLQRALSNWPTSQLRRQRCKA